MKLSNHAFIFLITLVFLTGCEISTPPLDERIVEVPFILPIKMESEVDFGPTGDVNYSLEFKPFFAGDFRENLSSFGTVSATREGDDILYLGLADESTGNSVEEEFKFTLRFNLPGLPTDRSLSAADLAVYFPPGTTFPFGMGRDSVQLGILLPEDDRWNQRSRSDFVSSPAGLLRVESIEEFSPESDLYEEGRAVYTLITFSFRGLVGVYRSEEDDRTANDEPHLASKRAEVNGRVTLNLAARPF